MASCLNYANATASGTCDCPPSLGGSTCSSLTCGNSILPPVQRPLLASGATSCASQCTAGWTGVGCNVCTTAQSCTNAIANAPAVNPGSPLGATSTNDTVVCNTQSYTFSQGFLSCQVDNPTLQAVYSGSTILEIQKDAQPAFSLSSPYGAPATFLAQLWYSPNATSPPIEQFYCTGSSCTQTNNTLTTGQTSYTCANLACTCIPSAIFCGGPGTVININDVINTLAGPIDIDCAADGSGTCAFKQATLTGLFGDQGLALSGCRSGECVRQSVIDALSTDGAKGGRSTLAGGVIAGLAVLGVIVAALVLLFLFGKRRQRHARRHGGAASWASLASHRQVGLDWRHVSYTLPIGAGKGLSSHLGGLRRRRAAAGKTILHEVSGSVPAGGLLAILGPSGAGKSTLVDILAGRRKVGRTTGSVSLVEPDGSSSPSLLTPTTIGYVDQEDVLPATSTVREALMFAAELKLPENLPRTEKAARVTDVLSQLGLNSVAESRIGSGERRGISGGERRRLSIGLELMAQPSVLILDEPTSGLDSVSAMRVVEVLRKLSKSADEKSLGHARTTVIACIHQPSSQIFHGFDQICLLAAGGHQLYFGPTEQAASYYAARGQPCPSGYNPADWLLQIASAYEPPSTSSGLDTPFSEHDAEAKVGLSATATRESDQVAFPPPAILRRRKTRPMATLMTQFEVIAARELKNLKRDKSLFIAQVAAASVVGIFVGGLYFKVDSTIAGFQNRIGSLFFLGSLLAFWAMSALSNLSKHRQLFLRERAASYYSSSVWLLSRALFDIIPLRIIPTIIVSSIVYGMVGLSASAAHYFKFLLILIEFSIAASLLNLFLAAVIPNVGVAILLSALLNLFQMAMAGFFVNLGAIPPVLRWLQWICPLKYTLEALSVNEVGSGLLIQDSISGIAVEISASVIMQLLFGFSPDAYYRDVLVLFGWIGLFLVALVGAVSVLHEVR